MIFRIRGVLVLATALLLALAMLGAGCTTAPGGNATATPTSLGTAAPSTTPTLNLTNLTVQGELAAKAASYAARLSGDTLTTAVAGGPASPEFRAVLSQVQAMKAEDARIAYVYTVEQINGTARFMVDAAYGTPNGSAPGELYVDAPKELRSPISAPGSTGVYTDEWGTFVTGYAPVRNGTGATVGLLLVDVEFGTLKRMLAQQAASMAARIDVPSLTTAIAKGENSTEYRAIARQLASMEAEDGESGGRIDYISIFQQTNGTSRFVADSEYGDSDTEHLGDTVIELPPQIPASVTEAGATDVVTDRWGTDFSGYAPIRDAGGKVVAVFRIDANLEV